MMKGYAEGRAAVENSALSLGTALCSIALFYPSTLYELVIYCMMRLTKLYPRRFDNYLGDPRWPE